MTFLAFQSVVKAAWVRSGACASRPLWWVSSADGTDQVDAMVFVGGQDVGGGDVSGVHHMLTRPQPPFIQMLVDGCGDLGVVDGGVGGLHVRDQVGCVRLAGLAQVDLVSAPPVPRLMP